MPEPKFRTAEPLSRVQVFLRLGLAIALVGLYTPFFVLAWLPLLPSRRARILVGNLYGKVVGRTVFTLAGSRFEIEGIENRNTLRPAIFISNHASTLDMWFGMWFCPYGGCGVAKKEIVKLPFFGQAYWLSGHLLLDRTHRDRAIHAMEKAAKVVREHRMSLWMWPEGTRSLDGRLQSFKKGFVHLAIACRLPVVPVVVHHAHRHWPGKTFALWPGVIQGRVLPAIDTSRWSVESVDAHVAEVWEAVRAALDPEQQPAHGVGPVAG